MPNTFSYAILLNVIHDGIIAGIANKSFLQTIDPSCYIPENFW